MMLIFMLEERSMKEFLAGLLPRILPNSVSFKLIAHRGKTDLEKSLPRKLRGWRDPHAHFVIVRDQDSGDCHLIKKKLANLCVMAGRPNTLIRIACRELESWFLADLAAVEQALGEQKLAKLQEKRTYRNPDKLGSPSKELKKLVPSYDKVPGAKLMGPAMDCDNLRSPSFAAFVAGVRRLVEP